MSIVVVGVAEKRERERGVNVNHVKIHQESEQISVHHYKSVKLCQK